ncbi:Uncharacterised protein [Mycobacterium tuberculosis]|uniref:Uncharacterized protein n=1 Tax=Mycobacterium tuberculosis TaxID=1773 RepID=A0A0T7LP92_MYCTX|nr:Uncharacterised protein [Mycobacterium tuberculosis]CFS15526.1 Uncharacterised protein [Mycobacterium tuberculosis]CKS25539.1 Uncharacterised protein [Mycobacterium tuberculosis]CKS54882.1 Uncharacterised protein [Mycobacterium tuberculosis]CKU75308.1 Uncharacterised protein [Mycobacterium tuberculosis]
MVISTFSRGTVRLGLRSPACGPAAVTSVPVTSTAARFSALSAVSARNGLTTSSWTTPSSGWPILT